MKKFSQEVCRELGYYVYRLIDPRDGSTFYVGKGKGNRVFDHARMALRFSKKDGVDFEDETSAKYKQIREIVAVGLEVLTVIHRHHIKDKETAYQIEGALIDAYSGLTNIQDGHGNADFGCASAIEVQNRYAAEEAIIQSGRYIIIKIRKEVIAARGSIYEAARKAWHINAKRAMGRLVIASVCGMIQGVFSARWEKDLDEKGRWCFTGKSVDTAEAHALIGKRLPKRFIQRGAASPIRYS